MLYDEKREVLAVITAAAVAVTLLFTHTRYLYIHIYTGHSSALFSFVRSFVLRSLSRSSFYKNKKKKLRRKEKEGEKGRERETERQRKE